MKCTGSGDTPRLICVAGGYTRYDLHAVREHRRSIDLVRYTMPGEHHVALETVASVAPQGSGTRRQSLRGGRGASPRRRTDAMAELAAVVDEALLGLGEGVTKVERKQYGAYQRLRNFACVTGRQDKLLVYLKVAPATGGFAAPRSSTTPTTTHSLPVHSSIALGAAGSTWAPRCGPAPGGMARGLPFAAACLHQWWSRVSELSEYSAVMAWSVPRYRSSGWYFHRSAPGAELTGCQCCLPLLARDNLLHLFRGEPFRCQAAA